MFIWSSSNFFWFVKQTCSCIWIFVDFGYVQANNGALSILKNNIWFRFFSDTFSALGVFQFCMFITAVDLYLFIPLKMTMSQN